MITESVWPPLDAAVATGRVPGYVAAVRIGGRAEIRAGGRSGFEPDRPPMAEQSIFRIASVTKPIGGMLLLSLVDDGVLALDDPISRWLPELADPRVLVAPDAELDRTTASVRPITVRHLITMTSGWGAAPEGSPLAEAMSVRGIAPSGLPPAMTPEEFLARLSEIPLAYQPGESWSYHTSFDVLSVLLARAAGRPLAELLRDRVTGPLGLSGTGFWAQDPRGLVPAYEPGPGGLECYDPPDGVFAAPPAFPSLSCGLVSTAPDLVRIFGAIADGGAPVLTAGSVRAFTSDALDDRQRRAALHSVGEGATWGLGTGVDLVAARPWMTPGRWGWTGGTGTAAYVDPARSTVVVLLTQRSMIGIGDLVEGFLTGAAR